MRVVLFLIGFVLYPLLSLGQFTVQGSIVDEKNNPLENVSIVTKHVSDLKTIPQFNKSDERGNFQLKLSQAGRFQFTISRVGYNKIVDTIIIQTSQKIGQYKMVKLVNQLAEVKIDYKYRGIETVKDTIRFSADHFRNGTERKLQELIEKMPGFTIEDGKVRFHGKIVNVTLVEGERFFGGGSKLAIENIPSDAVDKVEMVSRFSQNDVLKDVQVNDQLAMNVKLKANKKNFIFGDLESALGSNRSYKAHAALFFYSPERTFSTIGDFNNTGLSPVSKEDISRVQGAESQYFTNSIPTGILNSLDRSNRDVKKNINKLVAFNGFKKIWKNKLSLTLYGVFSENNVNSEQLNYNLYSFPNRKYAETQHISFLQKKMQLPIDLSFVYKPHKYFSLDYNFGLEFTKPHQEKSISTVIHNYNVNNNNLTVNKGTTFTQKQYLEGNWRHSLNRYSSFAFQQQYTHENNNFSLSSDSLFLQGFIKWDSQKKYHIYRPVTNTRNLVNISIKHYWVLNQHHQLNFELNSQNEIIRQGGQTSKMQEIRKHYLFNHDQHYNNRTTFLGVGYKMDWEKLRITLSLKESYLSLHNEGMNYKLIDKRWAMQPELDIRYGKNGFSGFRFNYKRNYTFAKASELNSSYWVTDFNSLFRGNIELGGQSTHRFNLTYNDFKLSNYRMVYLNSTVVLKDKIRANSLITSTYNQLKEMILLNVPDFQSFNTAGYSIRFGRLEPGIYLSYIYNRLTQVIDKKEIDIRQHTTSTDLSLRWFKPSYPDIKVTWVNTNSWQKNVITNDKIVFNQWKIMAKYNWKKNLILTTDWDFQKAGTSQEIENPISISANLELRYQKPKSPFSYYINGYNLLKNNSYRTLLLREYISSEKIIYTMPRIFMVGLSYKL